jgi:hypothetical protein
MGSHLRIALAALLLTTAACESAFTSTSGRAECDGQLDPREETVDDLFDGDGDGYFDAANQGCRDTYEAEALDCNDGNPDVNPGLSEVACNGLDDDCDPATEDEVDADADGYSLCDGDCADGNPDIAPGFPETTCDGLDNDCDPTTLDSNDIDVDGYSNCEDCVDTNENINPGLDEVVCDGADNDCDPLTPDGQDVDQDGSLDCFDCDDEDPDRFPGNPEICEDGIDQNCDFTDADCAQATWSGNWSTNAISYSCGGGNVDVNTSTVTIQDATPSMTFVFVGSSHPGAMTGTINGSNGFSASASYPGSCSKTFSLTGSFLGADSFSANLVGTFTGCTGCANQSWTLSGTR